MTFWIKGGLREAKAFDAMENSVGRPALPGPASSLRMTFKNDELS